MLVASHSGEHRLSPFSLLHMHHALLSLELNHLGAILKVGIGTFEVAAVEGGGPVKAAFCTSFFSSIKENITCAYVQ